MGTATEWDTFVIRIFVRLAHDRDHWDVKDGAHSTWQTTGVTELVHESIPFEWREVSSTSICGNGPIVADPSDTTECGPLPAVMSVGLKIGSPATRATSNWVAVVRGAEKLTVTKLVPGVPISGNVPAAIPVT